MWTQKHFNTLTNIQNEEFWVISKSPWTSVLSSAIADCVDKSDSPHTFDIVRSSLPPDGPEGVAGGGGVEIDELHYFNNTLIIHLQNNPTKEEELKSMNHIVLITHSSFIY